MDATHFQEWDKPKALWSLIGGLPAGSHVALTGGTQTWEGKYGEKSKELYATVESVADVSGVTIGGTSTETVSG